MTTPANKAKSTKEALDLRNSFLKAWRESVLGISVPQWCDAEKLADTLALETEQYYIERRLDERVERVEKTARNKGEAFINYSSALDDYCNAMMDMFASELQRRPAAFYRSDFPLSVLSRLDLLKHTQIKAYDFLKIWVNSFVNKASIYRGDYYKFDKNVETPSTEVSNKIADASNAADRACSSLLAYVRTWNVSSYEELLLDNPLNRGKLDQKFFDSLYLRFEDALYSLQDTILKLKPELYTTPTMPTRAVEMLSGVVYSNLF